MAEPIQLSVALRTTTGKDVRKLRRQGILPGVVYGFDQAGARPIQVDLRTFERAYHRAGTVHLIDLQVGETGPATPVQVHSVMRDPVSHILTHIDFLAVNVKAEMTAHVPIVLMGQAPAATTGDGVLVQILDAVEIRALPGNMPESLTGHVDGMAAVGDGLYMKDLIVPAGVTVLTDPEEMIARITVRRVEAVEETAATEAAEEAEDSAS